jgi:hypothetical protein
MRRFFRRSRTLPFASYRIMSLDEIPRNGITEQRYTGVPFACRAYRTPDLDISDPGHELMPNRLTNGHMLICQRTTDRW